MRTECLAEALDNEIEWGVWGGMTERERRAILRKRPNVTSWRTLLETAMTEHAGVGESQLPDPCRRDRVEPVAQRTMVDLGASRSPIVRRPSRSCTSVASAGRTAVATSG